MKTLVSLIAFTAFLLGGVISSPGITITKESIESDIFNSAYENPLVFFNAASKDLFAATSLVIGIAEEVLGSTPRPWTSGEKTWSFTIDEYQITGELDGTTVVVPFTSDLIITRVWVAAYTSSSNQASFAIHSIDGQAVTSPTGWSQFGGGEALRLELGGVTCPTISLSGTFLAPVQTQNNFTQFIVFTEGALEGSAPEPGGALLFLLGAAYALHRRRRP